MRKKKKKKKKSSIGGGGRERERERENLRFKQIAKKIGDRGGGDKEGNKD